MANTIALKRRIGSVKNTKQITKAMELVAASKMRKAQEHAQASRAYRESAYHLLARLSSVTELADHPLFAARPIKTRLHIVITSNRGLAGAYNSNVLRLLAKEITKDRSSGIESQIIAVGQKGTNFVNRLEGVQLVAVFNDFSDHPTANEVRPLLTTVTDLYQRQEVDAVNVVYTDFISNINQQAKQLALLPAKFTDEDSTQEETPELGDMTFEPSAAEVLDNVAMRLVEVQIWQAMLESLASEQSMRMMAMKSATDNATDLIDDLTLAFNTARQAAITQELAEITGGAEAIK